MAVALVHHATDGSPSLQLAVHPDQPGLGEALDHLRAVQELDRVVQTSFVTEPVKLWPSCDAIISLTPKSRSPRTLDGKKTALATDNQPPLISPALSADYQAASTKPRDLAAAIHRWLLTTISEARV